jgi:hypothetical protein
MDEQHHDLDIEAIAEQWAAELAEEFPDPVDVFEDDLARRLGLRRHPAMPLDQWRRLRVHFINAADDERS